ncbi:MAG: glutathione S-transferase [Beijerinckiaceae bacterium]
MMKLFWAPQSRAMRALWMMEEIGAPYERVLIDIRSGAQDRPEYRAINPLGKVPAIEDDGVVVSESGAVIAYLADRYPETGLAPKIGERDRGPYLKWLFYSPLIEFAILEKFAKLELPKVTAGWGSHALVVGALDDVLQKGPWLLGERFSAADVLIGSDIWYAVEGFKMIEKRPSFAAYIERCLARPAMQRAMKIGETAA